MNEATIFLRVAEWLDEQEYRIFVHIPNRYHNHSEYNTVIDQWPSHNITISGYRPDILGFTPTDQVFAVEVKGSSEIRKGFGQAASYRPGVDHAYLAADYDALQGLADIVHANGIGVLAVDKRDVIATHPHTIDLRDQLSNTRQQLEVLLTAPKQGSTFLPNYVDPLNNLLPVVAIAGHGCKTRIEVNELCEQTEYPYRSEIGRMLRLSQRLGLINIDSFDLTAQGQLAWMVLQGSGIETASALINAKDNVGRGGQVAVTYPALATFLQNRFAAVPAYRTLFKVLLRHPDPTITLQQLCERLLMNFPTTFFNLAYSDYSDNRDASRLVEEGQAAAIYANPAFLVQILNTNFTYNLSAQLKSIGVLTEGTDMIDTKADLAPTTDQWAIADFQLT